MQRYDDTLSCILDKHAPVQKKMIMERTKVPWFNDKLKRMKVKRRKLERKMLKSNCSCDKKLYRASCNKYSAKLKSAKRLYYSELIDQCSGDTRKLFKAVSSHSKVRNENPLPAHTDLGQLANEFGELFYRKIELIRTEIDGIAVEPPSVEYRSPKAELTSFCQLSEEEIYDIIINSSNATCKLDPIPTWLLKLCVNELKTVITKISSMSLHDEYVPDAWKVAHLLPILKKHGLEALFENFRPVNNLSFVSKIAERAVVGQLLDHSEENAPLPTNQSAYRRFTQPRLLLSKFKTTF